MSTTVKAKKGVEINTLRDVLDLIEKYGAENIEISYFTNILTQDMTIEDVLKFVEVASKDNLSEFLGTCMAYTRIAQKIANLADCNLNDVYNKIVELAIEHDININRVHDDISLETLNLLADKNLISLYYVENAKCIDTEFVRKHYESMDLSGLIHSTENDAVRMLANEYYN